VSEHEHIWSTEHNIFRRHCTVCGITLAEAYTQQTTEERGQRAAVRMSLQAALQDLRKQATNIPVKTDANEEGQ
jgi:hypothetical protein